MVVAKIYAHDNVQGQGQGKSYLTVAPAQITQQLGEFQLQVIEFPAQNSLFPKDIYSISQMQS